MPNARWGGISSNIPGGMKCGDGVIEGSVTGGGISDGQDFGVKRY